MTELINNMLDAALDWGLTEFSFWEMTIDEIQRAIHSKQRVRKYEAKEKAYFDYTLANLITKGVSKVLGDKNAYPKLEEAYPQLFEEDVAEHQAQIEEQKMNLSALRFTQFVNSFNKRYKEVANDK